MSDNLLSFARKHNYSLGAILFVQRGLDFTVRRIHGEMAMEQIGDLQKTAKRHITGRQLCAGLRDFAIEQYGLLALAVLRRWNIQSCEDFGRIVFAMIDSKLMKKTDEDSIEDFINVYNFEDAFSPKLTLCELDQRPRKDKL